MEEKQIVVNEGGVVNESGVSNSKSKITNADLVELGFPDIIAENTYFWNGGYMHTNEEYFNIQCNFYNALYVLRMLYEKYNNKTFTLEHNEDANAVYLDNEEVFYIYASNRNVYKHQHLEKIKQIVEELLTKISFEKLKQEFKELYAQEEAKIKASGGKVIYAFSNRMSKAEAEEYENKKNQFIEALKSDRVLAEKEVYRIFTAWHFGRLPALERISSNKLRDILHKDIISIRIYQDVLIISTKFRVYAVELSKTEKHKVSLILTLLKI